MFQRLKERLEDVFYAKVRPVPTGLAESALRGTDQELADASFECASDALRSAGGSFNSKVHMLPMQWRMVYTLITLDGQVRNGGFHQYFTNTRGVFDSFLLEDLAVLGKSRFTPVIKSAFTAYQGLDYTGQWKNIGRSWEYFVNGSKDGRFRTEEREYFSIKPGLTDCVGRYVRRRFSEYTQA